MTRTVRVLSAAVLCLTGMASHARATMVFDAADDFSPTLNPNGVWSYGQSLTLTSPFVLYTGTVREFSQLESWNAGSLGFLNPSVSHNPSSSVVTVLSISFQPGQLGFHPGSAGQYSIVRFTAPATGDYLLESSFSGLDFVGQTTTDVHVLLNSASLFAGNVIGFGAGPGFTTDLQLSAGDTLDFKVGWGNPPGSYFFDTTGLDARLTLRDTSVVPQPASGMLIFMGTLGSLGLAAIRRRWPLAGPRSS